MRKRSSFFKTASIILGAAALFFANTLTAQALPVLKDEAERAGIAVETNAIPNWPQGPQVSAQSAILMEAKSGAVLYAKNIHEQLYPASTTKLLTCLIAMENCSMDEVVTFSHDAIFDNPPGSSGIALDEGEQLTVEQCLNAILIASANEAAFGLAEHISGTTWRDFVDVMNERARQLGCVDSHFANPNGLPDEEHYSSAYDLAMIGRAFFANEYLCKVSSTLRLDLEPTDRQPDHIIEYSRNQLLPGRQYAYEYLVGSKTGYTDSARNTLVSCAEKNGLKLICVVLAEEAPAQFTDTIALFNYGFNSFESVNISQKEERFNIDNAGIFYSNKDIFGNSRPILKLNTGDSIVVPKTVPFEEIDSVIAYETGDESKAALITYSYRDQFLGTASVDFAKAEEGNPSESGIMQPVPDESGEDGKEEQNIVFINVFKVLGWILGVAAALALIVHLYSVFTNYHFERREKSGRRSWRRERKKKRRRFRRGRRR